jgi:pimeloyl-ACP methyl ester carboxylesterase
MPAIDANGVQIEYETFGNNDAPAILLVMGLGMQLTAWPDDFCSDLANSGYRVIRFDNRDIGLSTKFSHKGVPNLPWAFIKTRLGLSLRPAYTLGDMAKDSIGLMDGLGIAKAHVIGASMGGMISQIIAAKYPDRVLSLTSIMSSSGARNLPGPTKEAGKALMARPKDPKDMASVLENSVNTFRVIGSPGFPTPEAELRERFAKNLKRSYNPAGVARQLLAIVANGDRSSLLRSIKVPALVLHGDVDPLVPLACGQDTAAKIPGAKINIIKGMGHDMAAFHTLVAPIVAHCRAAAG